MSMLIFYVGESRYAIDNKFIIRIYPYVKLTEAPLVFPSVCGLLNLGGNIIPVIDFCQLMEEREAFIRFHTRIILVTFGSQGSLGIIGEKVIEISDLKEEDFNLSGLDFVKVPYLDGMASDLKGIIQRINLPLLFQFCLPKQEDRL